MVNIDWSIAQNALAQPDPGQRFAMGMELGRKQRQERQTREALGKYQADPEGAINQLMPDNPELAIRLQSSRAQQQRYAAAAQEDKQKQIAEAAKVLGPLYQQLAKMPYEQRPAFLQQIRPRLAAHGIPDEIIGSYDPTDANLQADIALSSKIGGTQPVPNIQREVDYYRSIGRPELADQLLVRHAEGPPLTVRNEDGTITILPPATTRPSLASPVAPQAGQADPATLRAQADEAIRAGADPAAVNARLEQMLKGGAGQSGPQTF